ncbi:MAG TPA: hypothetical protein VMM36_12400 [Opitutaceae bacterium]|nr:hypothetical protein [Opitutaceae bacterium]
MVAAVIIGVGGHVAALALVRLDIQASPAPVRKGGYVSIVHGQSVSGNLVVSEQLEYLNPEPLFMPTAWNAGEQPLPQELRRQPDQAFQSFDPQMTFSSSRLDPVFAPSGVAFEDPIRALDLGGSPRFANVGRREVASVSLERQAFIEVRRVGDGGLELAGPLSDMPQGVVEVSWAPISFLIAVNEVGLVGSAMIEAGSGNTEVDDAIRSYLGSRYRLGNRLNPGFYRVTVGP